MGLQFSMEIEIRPLRIVCLVVCALALVCKTCASESSGISPIYSNTNVERLFDIIFPDTNLSVGIGYTYATRANNWTPDNLNDVISEYTNWYTKRLPTGLFEIRRDSTESYWLGLLKDGSGLPALLSPDNCSAIETLSSNIVKEQVRFASILEKALFQRDVFQLYYILVKCTNAPDIPSDASLFCRQALLVKTIKQLLDNLRFNSEEYEMLTNQFCENLTSAIQQHVFEEEDSFDPTKNFMPLQKILCQEGWYEMQFASGDNVHFNHYGGRSFVRVFVQPAQWSQEDFNVYWGVVQHQFGNAVHLYAGVPPLPAGTKFTLLRTFAILMTDGTVVDSGIPEEILIRAFKTSKDKLDLNSTDYRGTYFYVYKMSRRALLETPVSLGLIRHFAEDPAFPGFDSDVPTLEKSRNNGAQIRTMRQQCIECHSLARYGSGTVFSLEHPRLTAATDAFSGKVLQAVTSKPGRYTFGQRDETLNLDK